ncbi:MAG: CDP-alcohol phosphatidyltransferase family protein [Halobacteria archaeon]
MTLDRIGDLGYRIIDPVVDTVAGWGVTPNQITVVSLTFSFVAAGSIIYGGVYGYLAAAFFVLFTGFLDILDGQVARRTGASTDRGDFLDHTIDRYADAVLVVGVTAGTGYWIPGFFAVSGVLLTAYMGTQADAIGLDRMYGGFLTRADILSLVFTGVILQIFFGDVLFWVLVLLAVGGNLTAVQRFVMIWHGVTE